MDRLRAHRPSSLRGHGLAILTLLLTILAILGCSLTQAVPPSPGSAPSAFVSTPAPASPTAPATPTRLPSKAILVASDNDPTRDELAAALVDLATQEGLEFEALQQMPAELNGTRITIAVVLTPIENLDSLVEASPGIQFLAVGLPGLAPRSNLTIIDPLTERTDDVAFIAGYMAALVSDDWRVASLTQADGPLGAASRLAFANGATFFCGLCRPSYPPYSGYPLDYPVPSSADPQTVQALLAEIEQDQVEIVFVEQGLGDSQIVEGLAQQNVGLIGVGAAEPASSTAWVASIRGDVPAALTSVWSGLVNGESGGELKMPLRVDVYDANRLTPGRFELLRATIDDLEGGYIDTGVSHGAGGSG
jgi:hypothetical protein